MLTHNHATERRYLFSAAASKPAAVYSNKHTYCLGLWSIFHMQLPATTPKEGDNMSIWHFMLKMATWWTVIWFHYSQSLSESMFPYESWLSFIRNNSSDWNCVQPVQYVLANKSLGEKKYQNILICWRNLQNFRQIGQVVPKETMVILIGRHLFIQGSNVCVLCAPSVTFYWNQEKCVVILCDHRPGLKHRWLR